MLPDSDRIENRHLSILADQTPRQSELAQFSILSTVTVLRVLRLDRSMPRMDRWRPSRH